jgi:diaminopimelate decarboxylase
MLAPGDIVALLDTGAYYASTPFHYNSLPDPAVHSVRSAADGSIQFGLLRPQESIRHVLARTGGSA